MASENKIFKIRREEEYTDPIYLELDLHNKDTRTAFLDIYTHINNHRDFISRFYPIEVLDNYDAKSRNTFINDTVELQYSHIKKTYEDIVKKELNSEREKRVKATLTYALNIVAFKMVKHNRPLSELGL